VDVQARHLTTKVSTWRGRYARLWCLAPSGVQHVDPATGGVTNTWPWADVIDAAPAVSSLTDFTFTVRVNKKPDILKFAAASAEARSSLLADLARYGGAAGAPAAGFFLEAVRPARSSVPSVSSHAAP
jgi:DnaJ family protein C protein 13